MASPFITSLRENMRLRGFSLATEKSYIYWIKRFIRFNKMQHPKDLGAKEVRDFLTHLAVEKSVAVNTQKSALNAVIFMYHKFFGRELGDLGFKLARRQRYVPTILTPEEVARVLICLPDPFKLIVELMYGSGMRISECLRLRVQDIEFEMLSLTIRDGKGNKDRKTLLSSHLCIPLKEKIVEAVALQKKDNEYNVGPSLPGALGNKYPTAFRKPSWAFLFSSGSWCTHPVTGIQCRHHLHASSVRKAIALAAKEAGVVDKRVNCHAFRHAFASHLLSRGTDIRTLQELLGHNDVRVTQIYCHVNGEHFTGTSSPLDALKLYEK